MKRIVICTLIALSNFATTSVASPASTSSDAPAAQIKIVGDEALSVLDRAPLPDSMQRLLVPASRFAGGHTLIMSA